MLIDKKGFTLIEILLVMSIIVLLFSITFPITRGLYDKYLLDTTAKEIRSALYMAQQLSIDESKNYCVEILKGYYRVREHKFGGKVVYSKNLDSRISLLHGSDDNFTYNRHGNTSYGKLTIVNKSGEMLKIEVMIGTGRVRISSL